MGAAGRGRDDPRISIDERTRVLVLSGAGISAESGLATFRGADGLWDGHPVEQVASPGGFAADPELVWRFYSMRRARRRRGRAERGPSTRWRPWRSDSATGSSSRPRTSTGSTPGPAAAGSWRSTGRCGGPAARRAFGRRSPTTPTRWSRRCLAAPAGPSCGPTSSGSARCSDVAETGRVDAFMRDARRSGDPFVFLAVGTSGNVYPAAGLRRRGALPRGGNVAGEPRPGRERRAPSTTSSRARRPPRCRACSGWR